MKFDHKTLFVMLGAMVLLSASSAHAITLGGSTTTPVFNRATAEFDPERGMVTSWVVNGQEQLGIGGMRFYLNLGDTREVPIANGSEVPGFGTFELVRTTTTPFLVDDSLFIVESEYLLDDVLSVEISYVFGSTGFAGAGEDSELASQLTFTNLGDEDLFPTLFELVDYSLNGAPTPGQEIATVPLLQDTTTIQEELGTSGNVNFTGGNEVEGEGGDLSPDGIDIDDVNDILERLNDDSSTTTSGIRDDSGDVAMLIQTDLRLIRVNPGGSDSPSPNTDLILSGGRLVVSPAPGATVIPEPTTALGTGLAFLGLCNYLTKRRNRTR